MTGTGSGSNPRISTTGVDSNISLLLDPKGTGGIGIGTSAPNSLLDVVGQIRSTRSTTLPSQYLALGPNTGSGNFITSASAENNKKVLIFESVHDSTGSAAGALGFSFKIGPSASSVSAFNITETGNVGIGWGLSTPADKLDVAGAIGLTTTTATLPINGIYSPAVNQLAITTSGANAIMVTSTGSVGIGTSAPDEKLEVEANLDSGVKVQVTNTSSGTSAKAVFSATSELGALTIQANSASYSDSAITGGMSGAGIWVPSAFTGGLAVGASGGPLRFFSNNNSTEKVIIQTNGFVGIGTTSPQSTLHVPDGKYAQFEDNNAGAPPATDCDADTERGRLSIDTTNNRLYVCNGAARGWDYVALTN